MPELLSIFTAEALIALATLTLLEIVLGIDNIVFISIVTGRLPESQRRKARIIGLVLAMVMRILLLLSIKWVMGLTAPLFTLSFLAPYLPLEADHEAKMLAISGRDLILIVGGVFLVAKATLEIHHKMEESGDHGAAVKATAKFGAVLFQIVLLDLVFSLDSVITAVGMAKDLWVMITAVVLSIIVMLIFAGPISRFVEKHVTVKVLALAFLILIGVTLMVEGFDGHVSKGYIYFAMAFSLGVEMVNLRIKSRAAKAKGKPAGAAGGAGG